MKCHAGSLVLCQSGNKLQVHYVYINTHKEAHVSLYESIEMILKIIKIEVEFCVTCDNW